MKASERELALRAMREAQWAAAAAELLPRRVTKIPPVTKKAVTKNRVTNIRNAPSTINRNAPAANATKGKRGRPKTGAAMTAAQRMREMRQRRKSGGG